MALYMEAVDFPLQRGELLFVKVIMEEYIVWSKEDISLFVTYKIMDFIPQKNLVGSGDGL